MMENALLIAENAGFWSLSLFLPTFAFLRVRDISVDIVIKAKHWYDDFSVSRRGRFSSEGSRVFITEKAPESKAMNAPQPTSFLLFGCAQCLVLNQISKHNMRSYEKRIDVCGGFELLQCQWSSAQRKGLLEHKDKYNTFMHNKCK